MFQIIWTLKALKQLTKIDKNQQQQIVWAVRDLQKWPDCRNVKALTDHKYNYRLRVGQYRVFFNMEKKLKISKIEEVKKRNGRTY
jgi:mRNA interferase RelE/StbE